MSVKLRKRQILAAGYIVVFLLLYQSVPPTEIALIDSVDAVEISQVDVSSIPIRNSLISEPTVNATAVYITDERSGSVLFSKNANTMYAPASTTKLMTALVARELYRPETVITIQLPASVGGTVIGLRNGEQYSLDSLLEAALIQSANDAAYALAQYHPQGVDGFVSAMNEKAAQLHLSSTHFDNPVGFDAPDHYSTARDLAILSRAAIQDEKIRAIVGKKEQYISNTQGTRRLILQNTNQLLGKDPRIKGLKTGTTEEAGEVLVTLAEFDEHSVLFVVLGSTSRYTDTLQLLSWLTTNVTWQAAPVIGSTDELR